MTLLNPRKDYPAEKLTKPYTKKGLETSKLPRYRKKEKGTGTDQLLVMFILGYLQHYLAISLSL